MNEKNLVPRRLAEKLKTIRKSGGWSQSEMLKQLGLEDRLFRSNISQYERGDRVPPPIVLLRYAIVAETSLESILDDQLELTP